MSIGGKTSEITKADLLDFAKQNDIKNANAMINRVADAIEDFNRYATENGIIQPWRSIIQKTLNQWEARPKIHSSEYGNPFRPDETRHFQPSLPR